MKRIITLFLVLCHGTIFATNIGGVINQYQPVTAVGYGCPATITVSDASAFGVGDLALIIQMKGASISTVNNISFGAVTNLNNAGKNEYVRIIQKTGNTLYVEAPLLNSYTISGKVQLVRVPEYTSVKITNTLTAQPWNGSTGGVLAFVSAGSIVQNAHIDVSGLGFRGGSRSSNGVTGTNVIRSTSVQKLGQMGEGISNVQWWGRGAPANGGGGSCGANSGGGGGANYGAGGNGGYTTMLEDWGGLSSHALGSYYGSSSLYRLFLGGGGGGGQQNNSYGTDGGNGGGIILIKGASFKNTNSAYAVRANGENAANATHSGNISDGAGGGGAGGCVSVTVDHLYSIHVEANGGKGGDAGEYTNDTSHGPGGGGGAGTYCLNFGSYDSYSTTSNGGGSGLSYFTGANGTPVGTGYYASNGAGGANMAYCGARQADTPADVVVACGDQTLVCEAGCAQLCVTNPQTTGTYSWSPTTGLNNPNISNPTACISTTTTYTVTYTNANGCVSTDQVTVSMPDKTLIITGDSHLCGGRYSATLCVEESTASWYKDGQPYTPPGGFANPQCITVTEPGTYYAITGLNVFPPNIKKYCAFAADDDCSCSQFQDLLPTLAGSNKVQDPCQSPVLGVPAVPGVSYSWTPTSGLSDPNIAQPTATPNTDRTYTLCASVNITGCQFTSCSSVFVDYRPYCSGGGGIPGKTDATGSMETGILLKVHPNPSRDMFNLELTGDDQMVQVDVLDLTGRTVLQVHPEQQKSTVDLTGMKQGIYMVKVRTLSGEEFVQRLMLAR